MKRLAVILGTIPLVPPLLQGQVSHASGGPFGSWCTTSGIMGGYGMGWFSSIFMIAFWVLILVGIFFMIRWLIRTSSGHKYTTHSGSSALEILKERYARGEIDRENFETMKRQLEQG